MAVPIGKGMSLKNVKTNIENNDTATVTSLNDAFSDSKDAGFDNTYYDGTKDTLQDFQGYDHVTEVTTDCSVSTKNYGTIGNQGCTDWSTCKSAADGNVATLSEIKPRVRAYSGTSQTLFTIIRAFLQFNLGSVPSGSNVTAAEFIFFYDPQDKQQNQANLHGFTIYDSSYTDQAWNQTGTYGEYDAWDPASQIPAGNFVNYTDYVSYQVDSTGLPVIEGAVNDNQLLDIALIHSMEGRSTGPTVGVNDYFNFLKYVSSTGDYTKLLVTYEA